MENPNIPELAQETPSKKSGLFALIGVILVTVIAGGIYYFSQTEATPPELTQKGNTYQGFIEDKELGAVQWEKKDLTAYETAVKALKKESEKKDKPLRADKDKVNIFFATRDTTLKEIIELTSRKEKGRVIWAVYQDKFIMTKNTFFNTVDDKKREIAIMVDPKKTDNLDDIEIKENTAVFIMADYDLDIHFVSKETDDPASAVTLDYFTKGWHVVAVKDLEKLLEDVDPTTYSVWGTKNNKDFKKLKTLTEKKNYNNIIWINVKADELVKVDEAAKKAADEAAKKTAEEAAKKAAEEAAKKAAEEAAKKAAEEAAKKTLTSPIITAPAPKTGEALKIEISPGLPANLPLITRYTFSINKVNLGAEQTPVSIIDTNIPLIDPASALQTKITDTTKKDWTVTKDAKTGKVTITSPTDIPAGTYAINTSATGITGTTSSGYATQTVVIPTATPAENKTTTLAKPTITAPAPAAGEALTITISPGLPADLPLITSYLFSVNLADQAQNNPAIVDSTDIPLIGDAHSTIVPKNLTKNKTNWAVTKEVATGKITITSPTDIPDGIYILIAQAKGAVGTTTSGYATQTVAIPAPPAATTTLTSPKITLNAPKTGEALKIEISPGLPADLPLITSYPFSVNKVNLGAGNPPVSIINTLIPIIDPANAVQTKITDTTKKDWTVTKDAKTGKVTITSPTDIPAGTYAINASATGAVGTTTPSEYTSTQVTIPAPQATSLDYGFASIFNAKKTPVFP